MEDFEAIYKQYFKDVFLFALSLSKDRHLAEDLTSETFLKALDAISGFKGTCDIRVWLCQITKNSYYSWLRKNNKLSPREEPLEASHETMGHPGDGMLELRLIRKEDSLKIHEILHSLGEPHREVFSLRVFSELSFRQIGDLFGKTENWACVTYHRARQKITKKWEEDNEHTM